jgi:hypothetical protein
MSSFIYKYLYLIGGCLPMRIITDNGKPYLERYYLGTLLGRRFYLHRFVGSDPMRGWHDHPWYPAYSLVLWGEYGEERCTPNEQEYRTRIAGEIAKFKITPQRVRWFNRLDERTAHRVVIGDDWTPGVDGEAHTSRTTECWTLFMHSTEYRNPWGFWHHILPQSKHFHWRPFDGKLGTATSGEWWTTAPDGDFVKGRVKPLT